MKLVKLSKIMDARICTTDFNLSRIASIQGIEMLNINDLVNAVKPVVFTGEELEIKLLKEGKEANQAIGYLEDGTMVVVSDGRKGFRPDGQGLCDLSLADPGRPHDLCQDGTPMKVEVIIVAAGLGQRLRAKMPKALIELKGRPLINHSLRVFEQHPRIDGIIIVAAAGYLSRFICLTRAFQKVRAIVAGGTTRQESVKSGLKALSTETKIVLVHDAARPFIDKDSINRLLAALKKSKAVVVGVPVKNTIKKLKGNGISGNSAPRAVMGSPDTAGFS